MMKQKRSERHHWWPKAVSAHWKDDNGGVTWLLPDGTARCSKPENFGVIGSGHIIKLAKEPSEHTPWDENFESVFERADSSFPSLIAWLEGLRCEGKFGQADSERFLPQVISDDLFQKMIECVISLAIRSPSTRHACAALAEMLQGRRLSERDRNAIIAFNMKNMHRHAVEWYGTRGKVVSIFSPHREFIFGDGFYHNLGAPGGVQMSPRILVPITPRISVLYAIPRQYREEPRLSTLVIDADEAEALNRVVQIYASKMLFFRHDRPTLIPEFRDGNHLRFSASRNIVEDIVHSLPGVRPRDTSLDFLEDLAVQQSF